MNEDISKLRNLGEKSARLLREAGISTIEDLRELGELAAYQRLRFMFGKRVSLNFLWAMYAGLRDIHWKDITADEKARLKAGLDQNRISKPD